ncbi:MAG: Uncharacterised protein [Cyanobium sp. ARS6]|nr:MAG: Uncharacterised protein [Cyanobium sp. ARS6]
MLGGFGFQFSRRADVRQQGDVDVCQVVATHITAELTDGFQKRQRLNVTHRAADFGDHHISTTVGGHPVDPFADFTGDVGNHLHRAAVVITAAFFVNHRLVDRTGGHAVQPRHRRIGEALVVTQVEVGFSPVFGHEDLAMLKRTHRAWVHIQVWIQLQDRNAVATGFEQAPKAGSHDAFADAGDDTTGDEDELGHEPLVDSSMYPLHQGVQALMRVSLPAGS